MPRLLLKKHPKQTTSNLKIEMSSNKVVVGKFGSVHGVRGDIRVHSFTEPTKNILSYQPWQIRRSKAKDWLPIEISHSQWHGEQLVVRIEGINDRDEAKQLTNLEIAVNRDQLPELPEDQDQYYWSDLMGLNVVNTHGVGFGIVDSYFETGANAVMVVKGDHDHLIPYTKDAIIEVDIAGKTITVDWDYESD